MFRGLQQKTCSGEGACSSSLQSGEAQQNPRTIFDFIQDGILLLVIFDISGSMRYNTEILVGKHRDENEADINNFKRWMGQLRTMFKGKLCLPFNKKQNFQPDKFLSEKALSGGLHLLDEFFNEDGTIRADLFSGMTHHNVITGFLNWFRKEHPDVQLDLFIISDGEFNHKKAFIEEFKKVIDVDLIARLTFSFAPSIKLKKDGEGGMDYRPDLVRETMEEIMKPFMDSLPSQPSMPIVTSSYINEHCCLEPLSKLRACPRGHTCFRIEGDVFSFPKNSDQDAVNKIVRTYGQTRKEKLEDSIFSILEKNTDLAINNVAILSFHKALAKVFMGYFDRFSSLIENIRKGKDYLLVEKIETFINVTKRSLFELPSCKNPTKCEPICIISCKLPEGMNLNDITRGFFLGVDISYDVQEEFLPIPGREYWNVCSCIKPIDIFKYSLFAEAFKFENVLLAMWVMYCSQNSLSPDIKALALDAMSFHDFIYCFYDNATGVLVDKAKQHCEELLKLLSGYEGIGRLDRVIKDMNQFLLTTTLNKFLHQKKKFPASDVRNLVGNVFVLDREVLLEQYMKNGKNVIPWASMPAVVLVFRKLNGLYEVCYMDGGVVEGMDKLTGDTCKLSHKAFKDAIAFGWDEESIRTLSQFLSESRVDDERDEPFDQSKYDAYMTTIREILGDKPLKESQVSMFEMTKKAMKIILGTTPPDKSQDTFIADAVIAELKSFDFPPEIGFSRNCFRCAEECTPSTCNLKGMCACKRPIVICNTCTVRDYTPNPVTKADFCCPFCSTPLPDTALSPYVRNILHRGDKKCSRLPENMYMKCHTEDCKRVFLVESVCGGEYSETLCEKHRKPSKPVAFVRCPNPSCKMRIERSGGCAHIKCSVGYLTPSGEEVKLGCGTDFCYCCGYIYKEEQMPYVRTTSMLCSEPCTDENMYKRMRKAGYADDDEPEQAEGSESEDGYSDYDEYEGWF